MTDDGPIQSIEDPDQEEDEGGIDLWKVIVFSLLTLILVFVLLGIFRFIVVGSYGGI